MSTRNKTAAGAIGTVAGLRDEDVLFSRAFAFPFAVLRFQKREPFPKGAWTPSAPPGPWAADARPRLQGVKAQWSRGWVRSRRRRRAGRAVRPGLVSAFASWGPRRLHCALNPSLLAPASVSEGRGAHFAWVCRSVAFGRSFLHRIR